MVILKCSGFLLILTYCLTAQSAESIKCPGRILVNQEVSVDNIPSGWRVSNSLMMHPHYRTAFMVEGDEGELREDSEKTIGDNYYYEWKISSYENVDVVCFFRNTNASLKFKLPKDVKSCSMNVSGGGNKKIYKEVTCE